MADVPLQPFSDRSDAELTALAADWDALDRHARRALLTEMKLRMARQGDRKGVIHIRTERRYGRLIRQPDGRVIRIETQVVHVRPLAADEVGQQAAAQGRQGFGVGFEQRIARRMVSVPGNTQTLSGQDAGESSGSEPADTQALPPLTIGEMLEGLEGPAERPLPLPIYQVADPAP